MGGWQGTAVLGCKTVEVWEQAGLCGSSLGQPSLEN